MTLFEAQEMYEAESARIWEDLNAPDPNERELIEASRYLKTAISHLDRGINFVMDAASELPDTPMNDKLESYIQDLECIMCDLKEMQKNYSRGVRE